MIRSFITITLRILWRNKVTSFVNIFSLSTGITSFIFIMLYVNHETSYDKFNENYDRIYRLEGDDYAKLPPAISTYIKDRIPEVINTARIAGGLGEADIDYIPEKNREKTKQARVNPLWADSTTFAVFTFPFIQGDPTSSLRNPFTCVLSERIVQTLFGDTNPIGKTVEFSDHQFEVTGILRNVEKSHFEAEALFSLTSIPKIFPEQDLNNTSRSSWLWSATYLLTTGKIEQDLVEKKINKVLAEINDGNLFDTKFTEFHLRPLSEIYFHGAIQNLDYGLHGSFRLISILSIIGIFMLVLACINYVNLSTARSAIRTKEVAVKRIVGSSVALVRLQLILESTLVSVISLIVALTFTQLFLGAINEVATVNIQIAQVNRPILWAAALVGALFLGVAAGIYPAFYLTAARPVNLIKGAAIGNTNFSFRNILMTFQFTLSIVLIVCALANLRQLKYVRSVDLGFNKEEIIMVETPDNIPGKHTLREAFKKELLQFPNILGVTYAAGNPGGQIPIETIEIDGRKQFTEFFLVDHDYFEVMNIQVLEGGSFFAKDLADFPQGTQETFPVLINESAAREFALTSPIGKSLYWDDHGTRRRYNIMGIVKDFHIRSLHHKISPLILKQTRPQYLAALKVAASNMPATIKTIEATWNKIYGNRQFDFKFLDETFDRQYKNDERLATIIGWFTSLALIIACLGLFALSSFMITRRTKEIGVRKSMGASVKSIYIMLCWDFLKWIIVAVMIGCPVSWYLMQLWLNKFAYHMTLGTDIFIIAALMAVGMALLTVTWQSLKAASANPIKSLRYE